MQDFEKKENRFFSTDDLVKVKSLLPGRYYPSFKRIWKKSFSGEKCPERQQVYMFLKGKFENDKILRVLLEMVNERKALKSTLKEVVNA